MAKPAPFTGVLTAIVTPFSHGELDLDALTRLVEDQLEGGVDGLVPCGTTGENVTLTGDEQARVIKRVVEAVRGRVPVVAGAGSNATADSIARARAARDAGADGIMLVVPYYNRPSQAGMVAHFKAIVREVKLPTILYNVPSRTASDLLPETVAELAALPEIVAIKEATGNLVRATQVIERCGDAITVLSGDDFTALPLFAVGARGVISVVSNVAPRWMSGMWDSFVAGRWDDARALHHKLQPLTRLLFADPNPVPSKAALALLGRMNEDVRLPLVPLDEAARTRLRAQLVSDGLLDVRA